MSRSRLISAACGLVSALAGLAQADGTVESTSIAVGHGPAIVRTRMTMPFAAPEKSVWLDCVPPGADADSLSIVPVSSPVRALAWARTPEGRVHADLATDFAGQRGFDVIYVITGLQWRATYQLVVRADPEREDAPVSMDVEGRLVIQNRSGAGWTNAHLSVVGAPSQTAAAPPPGILELDETSPLAGLWDEHESRESIPHAYRLERAVTLQPGEERAVTFVSVERRPAERRYRMSSDDVPLGTREPGRALRRFISLANDASNGLGRSLPPGVAQIYRGSTRAALGEQAWLERTPADGEIRIELGPSARVRGLRRAAEPTPGAPGEVEQDCIIEVRNELDSPARVEIEELPNARQHWSVVRSSHSYTLRNRRLEYRVEVPARDRLVIHYTIRMPAPAR